MQQLLEGYRRFRKDHWPERRALYEALADKGQSPRAAIIACADSRLEPAMIFGAGPGELFIIRNIANLVPPYAPDSNAHGTSTAIEFAVLALNVRDVIVMGHAMCGGIASLISEQPTLSIGFLGPWMAQAEPARQRALAKKPADLQTACEHEAVKLSLENLLTFPWVAERVAAGRLTLHGAHFDIRSGILSLLQEGDRFVPVK